MSTTSNTMLKGDRWYNQLKIISVTSQLSHWDLKRRKMQCEQDHNNLQEYPESEKDIQEYPEKDHQFKKYSEEYNQPESTETIKQEYINLDTLKNESIEELDSSDNFVHIKEVISNCETDDNKIDICDILHNATEPIDNLEVNTRVKEEFKESETNETESTLDTPNESIKVKNEISEELETSDDFDQVNEVTNDYVIDDNEKNIYDDDIIEELYSSNNCDQVKEEVTNDYAVDDNEKNIFDVLHSDTESKDNFEVNTSVKEEFTESETMEMESTDYVNRIMNCSKKVNHFENIDKILKQSKKVDWISKNSEEVDTVMNNVTLVEELPTLQCKLCFKVFLGDDAYNEHNMKKHTTNNIGPLEVKPSGVLKVDKPVPDKCTLVKVKKIRGKRIATDNSNEDNTSKSKTIRIYSESAKSADNNRDCVQNNVDININKVDIGNSTGIGESSTAIDEDNKDLLIEIPGKAKIIKLIEKESKGKHKKQLNVGYKKCDNNCPQSKGCRMDAHTCEICDYTCKYKSHLDAHMLTHKRVKNFKCYKCGYERCHLDQHMRTYSRTKPYSCIYCDYSCVQKSQLDQHIQIHTNGRPFTCTICGHLCKLRCHFNQHMRRHIRNKQYLCTFCKVFGKRRGYFH